MNFRLVLGSLIALANFCGIVSAQDTCEVSVPARFTTPEGGTVAGVTPDRLVVRLHNGARPLRVEVTEGNDAQVVLLLDNSGSLGVKKTYYYVGHRPPVKEVLSIAARRAVHDFLVAMPATTKVHLAVFSDKDVQSADGVRAGLELLSKLPEPKGKTYLLDTISSAAKQLAPMGGSVIAFTDGGDNQSKVLANKLTSELTRGNVRVSFLMLMSENPGAPEEVSGPYDCEGIAHKTIGVFAKLPEDGSLTPPLVRGLLFRTQIKMTIPKSAAREKWKLEILKPTGMKKVLVHTLDHIPSCDADNQAAN